MRRIKLEVAYDGSNYSGWQTQPDRPTIQETIEKALQKIVKKRVGVTGSGRTDAGVHALKQVAAFTTDSLLEPSIFQRALNGFLPPDIRIVGATEVALDFHPIADAVSKRYRYLIDDRRPSFPMTRNYCWVFRESLDAGAMREAARHLTGEHDFSCFETQGSPRTTSVRTVFDVLVDRIEEREGFLPPLIRIEVEANGFLYNMMRAIAGTLTLIGVAVKRGKDGSRMMQDILESKNRALAGPTAPPQGLYLLDVRYP